MARGLLTGLEYVVGGLVGLMFLITAARTVFRAYFDEKEKWYLRMMRSKRDR